MDDDRFHYPPDIFSLLVDTIPLLCKGKDDVILFLRGAGVPNDDLEEMAAKVRAERRSVSKFAIVRNVLEKLNKRGDAGLRARRKASWGKPEKQIQAAGATLVTESADKVVSSQRKTTFRAADNSPG